MGWELGGGSFRGGGGGEVGGFRAFEWRRSGPFGFVAVAVFFIYLSSSAFAGGLGCRCRYCSRTVKMVRMGIEMLRQGQLGEPLTEVPQVPLRPSRSPPCQ